MPDEPLILLPPSEGKLPGGDGPVWSSATMSVDLDGPRHEVAIALISAMEASSVDRSKLLGVKGAALDAATRANLDVLRSPTMAAIERYDGVLYGAIDAPSLSADERTVMERSVLIVSGLWGLVAPSDPIPLYKLKMGARVHQLGRLSTWWRPAIAGVLDRLGHDRIVWNLLPKEHDAALARTWAGRTSPAEHYAVTFLQPNAKGELTAVSHWNKFLKGALVRHLVQHPGITPSELQDWEHPSGFRLDAGRTITVGGRKTLVFVKGDGNGG